MADTPAPGLGHGTPVAPPPPGATDYQSLLKAGGTEAADAYKAQTSQQLYAAGAKPSDVNAYWGDTPQDYKPIQDVFQNNLNRAAVDPAMGPINNPMDAMKAGWNNSASSILFGGGAKAGNENFGDKAGFWTRLTYGLAQTAGDLPVAIPAAYGGEAGGTALGSETGPGALITGVATGGFAGMATPQAVREANRVMQMSKQNQNMSAWDYSKAIMSASYNTVKAGVVGEVTGGLGGKAAGTIADMGGGQTAATLGKLATEATVMPTTSAALDGRLPTAQDMATSALMVGGMHIASAGFAQTKMAKSNTARIQGNIEQVYRQAGVKPEEQIAAAQMDPGVRQDLATQDVHGNPNLSYTLSHAPDEPAPFRTPPAAAKSARDVIPMLETGGLTQKQADSAVSVGVFGGHGGAIGAHQIMPATARQYMGSGFDVKTLFDPKVNAQVYDKIMTNLEKRFPGNPNAQMIAYNAGPGRAGEYLTKGAGTQLEAIPDKSVHGGVRYETVPSLQDESFLPRETQQYLANGRRHGIAGAPTGTLETEPAPAPEAKPEEAPAPTEAPATMGGSGGSASTFEGASVGDLADEIMTKFKKPEDPDMWNMKNASNQFVSELMPARSADAFIKNIGGTPDIDNAFRLNYASRAIASLFMKGGIVDYNTKAVSGPDYETALQMVKSAGGNPKEWTAYRIAQRVMRFREDAMASGKEAIETPVSELAAAEMAKNPEAKAKYQAATDMVNQVKNGALQYAKDAGVYSQESLDALLKNGDVHIVMRRLMGDGKAIDQARSSKFSATNPLAKMEGHDGMTVDPTYTEPDNIARLISAGNRNAAVGTVIKNAEAFPEFALKYGLEKSDSKLSDQLDSATEKQLRAAGFTDDQFAEAEKAYAPLLAIRSAKNLEPTEFNYFRDGKPEVWKTNDPNLARLLKGIDSVPEANVVMTALKLSARLLRNTVVLPADFIIKVTGWHQWNQFVFDPMHPLPYATWARGAVDAFGGTPLYKEAAASGALQAALADVDKDYLSGRVEKVFQDTGVFPAVRNGFNSVLEASEWVHQRMDAANRIGLYKTAKGQGADNLQAAMAARRAGIDYAEHGSSALLSLYSSLDVFLNPHIRGLDQAVTAFKKRPLTTAAYALGSVSTLNLMMYGLNRQQDAQLGDDEKDKSYEAIPRWIKDNYLITPMIDGQRAYIKMPAFIGFAFGGLAVRMADGMFNHDPAAFNDVHLAAMKSILPDLWPTAIKPAIEVNTNYDFYSGRAMTPSGMENLTGHLQYTPDTTNTAKAISRLMGRATLPVTGQEVSPIQVEHLVKGYAGPVGMGLLHILDAVTGHLKPPSLEAADNVFISSFLVRNPGFNAQQIQDFYDEKDKYMESHADLAKAMKRQAAGEPGADQEVQDASADPGAAVKMQGLVQVTKAIQNGREDIDAITNDKDMTTDEKRQKVDAIYSDVINMAKGYTNDLRSQKEGDNGGQTP